MRLREHLPGACWLASIACMACYFLYEGLEARPSALPAGESVRSAAPRVHRVAAVRPSGADVVVSYVDAAGETRTLVLTADEAARHLERLDEAADLAAFLRGFGDSPLLTAAPLDDGEALKGWFLESMTGIDRASAAEYPGWFRSAIVRGARRFDLPLASSPAAAGEGEE